MSDLSELFPPENIIFDFKASSKEDAILKLLQKLLDNSQISFQKKELYFQKILERENSKTTGIGCGIAIPHCTTPDIKKTIGVVGLASEGINFQSNDNCLVHIFFLFIFPNSNLSSNLDTLSYLTSILGNDSCRCNILKSKNFKDFQESLRKVPLD